MTKGDDDDTTARQVAWMCDYIARRYGGLCLCGRARGGGGSHGAGGGAGSGCAGTAGGGRVGSNSGSGSGAVVASGGGGGGSGGGGGGSYAVWQSHAWSRAAANSPGGVSMARGMSGFDGNGELAVGTVTGVRGWRLESNMRLRGSNNVMWRPGVNVAQCMPYGQPGGPPRWVHAEPVPYEECGCGIWLYWTLQCPACYDRAMAHAWAGVRQDEDFDLGKFRAGELSQLVSAADFLAGRVFVNLPAMRDVPPRPTLAVPITRRLGAMPCGVGSTVHGVVEGSGLTLIGDVGARSAKAELLALCVPSPDVSGYGMHGTKRTLIAAHLERTAALGKIYRVPVYGSVTEMLTEHPLTADYRPKAADGWGDAP
jgi:hypothetical protein